VLNIHHGSYKYKDVDTVDSVMLICCWKKNYWCAAVCIVCGYMHTVIYYQSFWCKRMCCLL